VEGVGEQGRRGARAGDLYLRIFVKEHPAFERKGDDLFLKLPISFSKAVLGGEVELMDLANQRIVLSVPAGSEPGKVLRLSGKGIPHFQGKGSGHLYVQLDLKMPRKLSQKQKEILEQLRREDL